MLSQKEQEYENIIQILKQYQLSYMVKMDIKTRIVHMQVVLLDHSCQM